MNEARSTDLIEIYLRIQRQDIALIKFVFESYEGVGIVRTVDKKKATVVVLVMPDFIDHARAILDSLREHTEWHEIPPPAVQGDWLIEKMHS